MVCTEIMKRDIQAIRPEDNLHTAARRMRDKDVGFLPVVDEQGRPVGTLTDRDLAVRAVAEDRKPSSVSVREVMSLEPVTCEDADDLGKAEELMERFHKSRIMCVDAGGTLVGVISLSDILDAAPGDDSAEVVREVAHREAHPTVM